MESIAAESKVVINTKDGPICGYIEEKNEKIYHKFRSIPYAKPPVGNLRFQPPVPVKPWTELKDCTQESPTPISISNKYEVVGSEDCLYLDVTIPCIKSEQPLPVMFWIGTYCFNLLIDDHFEPSFLIDEGVIFVRCGFRLGAFGFLAVNDFMAPGNCGLKDIVLALRWVQRNIAEFGGDPNNVTIFGSSAGGASVHLLMLSPMASGLFHKAIIQSASALNYWSLVKNPIHPTMELAKALGITTTCALDVIEELKQLPAITIASMVRDIEMKILEEKHFMNGVFKPCIEQEFEGQPTFLTKSPMLILKSGNFNKVPLIIGANNIEASILQFLKVDFYKDYEKYNQNPELIVPRPLQAEVKISRRIGKELLKFYLDGDIALRKDTRTQYLQLMSDYYFLYYVHKTVQLHSEHSPPNCPIYYYILNHGGEWYDIPEDLSYFNSMGHGAELPFVFGLKLPHMTNVFKGSKDSVKTRKRVVKMWTNFVKYGNPTPDEDDVLLQIRWDPVEKRDKLNYLSIGAELTKGRNPFLERMKFWEGLHKENMFLRVLVYFNDMGVMW